MERSIGEAAFRLAFRDGIGEAPGIHAVHLDEVIERLSGGPPSGLGLPVEVFFAQGESQLPRIEPDGVELGDEVFDRGGGKRPPGRTAERDDGGSPAAGFGGGVLEGIDKWGSGKHGADDFAPHSDAASVDDAEGGESPFMGRQQIFLDGGTDVLWRKGMEVYYVRDGDGDGRFLLFQ